MRVRAFVLIACLLGASSVLADEKSDFEKARIAYVKKDYGEATTRFEAMLNPTTGTLKTKELITEAEFCFGAVKFAQGNKDEARKLWEKVIRDMAGQYQPDPLTYPSDTLNTFIDQQRKWNDEINQQQQSQGALEAARRKREAEEKARLEKRIRELEAIASQETVIVQNSRVTAILPFGIGQFQNGQNGLGWLFLLTEGVAVASTGVLFFPYRYNVDQANAALSGPGTLKFRQTLANDYAAIAQDIRTADFIILGALGGIALTGIIQAQIAFKPTITFTRKRNILQLWPSFSPMPNGAALGLHGTF